MQMPFEWAIDQFICKIIVYFDLSQKISCKRMELPKEGSSSASLYMVQSTHHLNIKQPIVRQHFTSDCKRNDSWKVMASRIDFLIKMKINRKGNVSLLPTELTISNEVVTKLTKTLTIVTSMTRPKHLLTMSTNSHANVWFLRHFSKRTFKILLDKKKGSNLSASVKWDICSLSPWKTSVMTLARTQKSKNTLAMVILEMLDKIMANGLILPMSQ